MFRMGLAIWFLWVVVLLGVGSVVFVVFMFGVVCGGGKLVFVFFSMVACGFVFFGIWFWGCLNFCDIGFIYVCVFFEGTLDIGLAHIFIMVFCCVFVLYKTWNVFFFLVGVFKVLMNFWVVVFFVRVVFIEWKGKSVFGAWEVLLLK